MTLLLTVSRSSAGSPLATPSAFSSALASRCTAERACSVSCQMPAAENATISAKIALITLIMESRIGGSHVLRP